MVQPPLPARSSKMLSETTESSEGTPTYKAGGCEPSAARPDLPAPNFTRWNLWGDPLILLLLITDLVKYCVLKTPICPGAPELLSVFRIEAVVVAATEEL